MMIVAIVLLFNGSFLLLIHIGHLDDFITGLLINAVEKALNCEFHIGHYSLNDKQLFASDIRMVDNNGLYHVTIENLHIDYNIFHLLQFNRRSINMIPGIRIYNPVIELVVTDDIDKDPDEKAQKKEKRKKNRDKKFSLSDISYPNTYVFFKRLNLYDGIVNLSFDTKDFQWKTQLNNININAKNEDLQTTVHLSITDSLSMNLDLQVSKMIFRDPVVELEIQEALVKNMTFPSAGTLNSSLTLHLENRNRLEYSITISETDFLLTHPSLENMAGMLDRLNIFGDEDILYLETTPIRVKNGEKFLLQDATAKLNGSLVHPLDFDSSDFIVNLVVDRLRIPSDVISSSNTLTANLLARGNYEEIAVNTRIFSDLIQVTLPFSDTLTINENIRGVDINIQTPDVLTSPFDISITIANILDTRLRAIGSVDVYDDLKGHLRLFADDLLFHIPVAYSPEPFSTEEAQPRTRTPRGEIVEAEPNTWGLQATQHISSPTTDTTHAEPPRRRGGRRAQDMAPEAVKKNNFIHLNLSSNFTFSFANDIFSVLSDVSVQSIIGDFMGYSLKGDEIMLSATSKIDTKSPLPLDTQVNLAYSLYDGNITGDAFIDLKSFDSRVDLNISHFDLHSVNKELPPFHIDSSLSFSHDSQAIKANLSLITGDILIKDFYIISDMSFLYDKMTDTLDIAIDVHDSYINYTPLFARISASGTKDHIESRLLNINDMLAGDFFMTIPDEISSIVFDPFSLYSERSRVTAIPTEKKMQIPGIIFNIQGENINIVDISQYFLNHNVAKDLTGEFDINLSYDNINNPDTPLSMDIDVSDFIFLPLHPVNVHISATGDIDNITVENLHTVINGQNVLSADISIEDLGKKIYLKAHFSADIQDIQEDKDFKGLLNADIYFQQSVNDVSATTAHIILSTDTIFYQNKPLLRADIDIQQLPEKLQINHAEIHAGSEYFSPPPPRRRRAPRPAPIPQSAPIVATISGALNYNLITDTIYSITDSLYIAISGDPVKMAQDFVEHIIDGESKLHLDAFITIDDDGLQFPKGSFALHDTWIRILDQQELLDRVHILAHIADNVFHIDEFIGRMGRGFINIRNEISPIEEENLLIANLNLGKYFVHTSDTGLQVHAPGFLLPGTSASVVIRGRHAREATITGPIDEMKILADVEIFNSNIVFPERTNNLFEMVNFLRMELRQATDTTPQQQPELPFHLDLRVILSRNNRYMTYPMSIILDENCFAHITFDGKEFVVNEANIRAERGHVELFGTFLALDYAEIMLSHFEKDIPSISVSFNKKVADGTTVFLHIFTDRAKGNTIADRLTIELTSDDPTDLPSDVLTKLRYGKSFDELSEAGGNILQDEILQLFVISTGSAWLDPFIAPIENRFRRLLRLDNMSINPGIIQNMVAQRIWNDFGFSDDHISNFSSSILLNNLSVQLGKYVHKNVFCEYEIFFLEGTDLSNSTDIFLYHTLGLRYDLPWRLQARYSYAINPKSEPNSHEVFIMRAFRF
jgi:hypothetical protein